MSDEKAADAAQAKAPAAAPKSSPPFLLIGVVVAALAVGSWAGMFLVGPKLVAARAAAPASGPASESQDAPAKEKKGKKGEGGKPSVYRIDNLIVNPAGSQGQRFLMCSVALELPDDKTVDLMHDHDVEIRDAIVSVLESQTLEEVTRPGARDTLRARIANVTRPYAKGAEFLRVFLPQFVIQ